MLKVAQKLSSPQNLECKYLSLEYFSTIMFMTRLQKDHHALLNVFTKCALMFGNLIHFVDFPEKVLIGNSVFSPFDCQLLSYIE